MPFEPEAEVVVEHNEISDGVQVDTCELKETVQMDASVKQHVQVNAVHNLEGNIGKGLLQSDDWEI